MYPHPSYPWCLPFCRWDNIAKFVGTKSPDQVLKQTKPMTHQLSDKAPPSKATIMSQGDDKVSVTKHESVVPKAEDLWAKAMPRSAPSLLVPFHP